MEYHENQLPAKNRCLGEKVSRRAGTDEGPSGRCDADPHTVLWYETKKETGQKAAPENVCQAQVRISLGQPSVLKRRHELGQTGLDVQ